MDVLLIPGLWLNGGTVWADVASALEARGHRPVPITLPGQGDGASSATLADQVAAVLEALDTASDKSLVVGHSAAATLAWMAADARPEQVAKVVFIGGWPTDDGEAYAAFFDLEDGVMPFPGWGPFEGADSADLDEETKQRIAAEAIAVPGEVASGVVHLADGHRYDIPAVLVCPEFNPDEAKEWVASGDLPELAKVKHLDYVDIDSGHWPMFTRPAELAEILARAADEV